MASGRRAAAHLKVWILLDSHGVMIRYGMKESVW
ncbi:hypothetical protein FBY22_1168 [Streptomyces sp. SLBN-31]|nr:hypothetical protein FBY22_1168 [Streptomyces sp. SLBN-31]